MFGRKKDDADQPNPGAEAPEEAGGAGAARNPGRSIPAARPVTRPQVVHRPPDIHGTGQRREREESEGKRLIVGRDITLAGEIKDCDKLVVEGRVEANLPSCHEIEIAATGTFKGEATIETADISGTFEGALTARTLLIVRSTGKIRGTVRYGQIEIERGGEIHGDIATCESVRPVIGAQSLPPQPQSAAGGE